VDQTTTDVGVVGLLSRLFSARNPAGIVGL
jgi:hypothetical protein